MMKFFKRRLFWKFFFSYFMLVLFSMLVLGIVIRLLLPGVFESHLVRMTALFSHHGMGGGGQMPGGRGRAVVDQSLFFMDLFTIFNEIIFEAVMFAVLPSIIIALGVSAFMSQQLVSPLQQMTKAADRIAEGDYQERLPLGDKPPETHDEIERLAVRFNRMTARLEQIEEIRQQLIGDVAHELRTPLTVIKGVMEGLTDGVLEPNGSTFEMIYRQADRLERLVYDLQELNHIEMGILDLTISLVNIKPFLENIVHTMRINYSDKDVQLSLNLPINELIVFADADRLEQVMINLLSNALRYTSEGGEVRVVAEEKPGKVQISVEDKGIGIPPEHLPHVFSRFYRVDGSRSREVGGSGIGLTIVKKLVEAQDGTIWAESSGQGEGAAFRFTLPRA